MDSALVLIIAKIVAIVEELLDSFVTVDLHAAVCNADGFFPAYTNATLSCEGIGLAHSLEAAVAVVAQLVPALLQGLAVVV